MLILLLSYVDLEKKDYYGVFTFIRWKLVPRRFWLQTHLKPINSIPLEIYLDNPLIQSLQVILILFRVIQMYWSYSKTNFQISSKQDTHHLGLL